VKQRRECPQGHAYFKSSDCPTCPRCETARKPAAGFLADVPAPARRALEAAGLTTLARLERRTEKQMLELHGMGPNAVVKLSTALKKAGMRFSNG
jgi:hypothetical protein